MIKPTSQTAAKQKREREPDVLDVLFDALTKAHPDMADVYVDMKRRMRHEVGGSRVYIKRRDDLAAHILAMFNGRNAGEVARALGIGRTTVYRVLRGPGR